MSTDTKLTLKGVWGEATGEKIWAVGQNGLILKYDGVEWRIDDVLEKGDLAVLDAIEGDGVLGPITVGWEVEPNDMTDSEGNPGGSKTRVYELKKDGWVRVDPGFNGKPRHLLLNRRGLYVIGTYLNQGTIWKRIDNEWVEQRVPFEVVRDAAELSNGRIVFIVERNGFSYLVDEGWKTIKQISGDTRLNEIISHSNDSVTAVGRSANGKGLVLHGKVSGTIVQYEVGSSELRGVAALSQNDIYAVGNNGVIAHYDGNEWRLMDSGTSKSLYGVWASKSTGDVIAVGNEGTILQYACPSTVSKRRSNADQSIPACSSYSPISDSSDLYGVWGHDVNSFLVAGKRGVSKVVKKQLSRVWTRSNVSLFDMNGTADFSYAVGYYATADQAVIVRCTMDGCEEQSIAVSGTLHSVWVGESGDAVAAGLKPDVDEPESRSLILQYQKDTKEWKVLDSIGYVLIEDFWGQSATDLWAAGTDWGSDKPIGVVLHFDGQNWKREYESTGFVFRAISGSDKLLASGGGFNVPDENRRLGKLVVRKKEVWEDANLDKTYSIWSLDADQDTLFAGFVQVLTPTIEYTRGLIDLTDLANPRVVCTGDEPIEDIERLGDSTIVAVGSDGSVFFVPTVE